jgi:hypothetical protein
MHETGAHDPLYKTTLTAMHQERFLSRSELTSEIEHRRNGSIGLAALGPLGLRALASGVTNSDKWLRRGCIINLVDVGGSSPLVVESLLRGIKDREGFIRIQSALYLGRLGKEPAIVVPALCAVLDDSDELVASVAADAIGRFGEESRTAVPLLMKRLTSPNPELRLSVERALKQINGSAAAATWTH